MPRAIPTTLANLLANPRVESFSTLRLDYSDPSATVKRFATRAKTIDGHSHTARLKKVSDVRQTLSAATDRVAVQLYNNDLAIGLDVASDLRYFAKASGTVGRFYQADNTSDTHHSVIFTGRVANAEVTTSELRLDIIDSFVAAGDVIASRSMTQRCQLIFKGFECQSTDPRSSCSKDFEGPNSCSSDTTPGQKSRFGGWWFPWSGVMTAPTGTEGGDGGGGVIRNPTSCFRDGTMITMADGSRKPIEEIREGMRVLCFYYDENLRRDVVTESVVTATSSHEVYENYRLGFEGAGKKLGVTGEHPLYRGRGAFYFAGHAALKQIYKKLAKCGSVLEDAPLTSLGWEAEPLIRAANPVTVYDLTIARFHTYFADDVAVHNKPYDTTSY